MESESVFPSVEHSNSRAQRSRGVRATVIGTMGGLALAASVAAADPVLLQKQLRDSLAVNELEQAMRLLEGHADSPVSVAEAVSRATLALESSDPMVRGRAEHVVQYWLPRLEPLDAVLGRLQPGTIFSWHGKTYDITPDRGIRIVAPTPLSLARYTRDGRWLATLDRMGLLRISDSERLTEHMVFDMSSFAPYAVIRPPGSSKLLFLLHYRAQYAGGEDPYAFVVDPVNRSHQLVALGYSGAHDADTGCNVAGPSAQSNDALNRLIKACPDSCSVFDNDDIPDVCVTPLAFPQLLPESTLWGSVPTETSLSHTVAHPDSGAGEPSVLLERFLERREQEDFDEEIEARKIWDLTALTDEQVKKFAGAVAHGHGVDHARIDALSSVYMVNPGITFGRMGGLLMATLERPNRIVRLRRFEFEVDGAGWSLLDANRCTVIMDEANHETPSVRFVRMKDLSVSVPERFPDQTDTTLFSFDSASGRVALLGPPDSLWVYAADGECRYSVRGELPLPEGVCAADMEGLAECPFVVSELSWTGSHLSMIGQHGVVVVDPVTGSVVRRREHAAPKVGHGAKSDAYDQNDDVCRRVVDGEIYAETRGECRGPSDRIQLLLTSDGVPLSSAVALADLAPFARWAREEEPHPDVSVRIADGRLLVQVAGEDWSAAAVRSVADRRDLDLSVEALQRRTGFAQKAPLAPLHLLPGAAVPQTRHGSLTPIRVTR